MGSHNEKVQIPVEGMTCTNCARSVENYLKDQGYSDVFVDVGNHKAYFTAHEHWDVNKIAHGLDKLGFSLGEMDSTQYKKIRTMLILAIVFTAPLLVSHILMSIGIPVPELLLSAELGFILASPVLVLGLKAFGKGAWSSLIHLEPNMDVLILLGSIAAYIYSIIGWIMGDPSMIFFETTASIITLVLIGNFLEHRALKKTTSSISELQNLRPETAMRVIDGKIEEIQSAQIQKGDYIMIREGEHIPIDGIIQEGEFLIDESWWTGENLPVEKEPGDEVISGTLAASGNGVVIASDIAEKSLISKLVDMVFSAQADKPEIQRLADKISNYFVPVVIGLAIIAFLLGYYVLGFSLTQSILNSVAVLVISCPCAMGLATPTAVSVGVGMMAKKGLLVKKADMMERLAKAKYCILDKTGTLTENKMIVANIKYHGDQSAINSVIYGMESRSDHPIANSIMGWLKEHAPETVGIDWKDITEVSGKGIEANDGQGNVYFLGKSGVVDVHLTKNGSLLAEIQLEDLKKTGIKELGNVLKNIGIQPIILSGDHLIKVRTLAKELGSEEYYGGKNPQEKLNIVKAKSSDGITCMAGDGINDSAALAMAHVGISMGNASDLAISNADAVVLNDKLETLAYAFKASKATYQTIRQNLFWAMIYNVIAIPLAAMGYINPMWAAGFMAFSDVVVIGNSLRLKSKKLD